jgi:glyoxylate carboligase
MRITGAQAVWESFVREGVDTIFGISGGAVIHLYDALPNYPIHHILTRHEQGAAHAADGYARATGKVGGCIATSGPGATNLVTGQPQVVRELALIKVTADAGHRTEIMQLANVFRARVIDVGKKSLTIEITGPEERVDSLIGLLVPFGIEEIARTGRVAMVRSGNGYAV